MNINPYYLPVLIRPYESSITFMSQAESGIVYLRTRCPPLEYLLELSSLLDATVSD